MAKKQGWFDRVVMRKMKDAGMGDDELREMREDAKDALPAIAFDRTADDMGGVDGDQHVHVHLHNGKTDDEVDPMADPNIDPNAKDPGQADPAVAELAARVDALEQQVAQLLGGEEDVELEDADTQDRRRFKLRRGDALKKTRDEDMVPDREPEIIGETDLPGIEDLNKKTADSIPLEALWQSTVANAEVIVPGYRLPTFDAKHHPSLTAKRLCALRRGVLCEATKDAATRAIIGRFSDADPKKMVCDALKIVFNGTAEALKAERNGGVLRTGTGDRVTVADIAAGKVPSNRDANKIARDFWETQGNGAIRH